MVDIDAFSNQNISVLNPALIQMLESRILIIACLFFILQRGSSDRFGKKQRALMLYLFSFLEPLNYEHIPKIGFWKSHRF